MCVCVFVCLPTKTGCSTRSFLLEETKLKCAASMCMCVCVYLSVSPPRQSVAQGHFYSRSQVRAEAGMCVCVCVCVCVCHDYFLTSGYLTNSCFNLKWYFFVDMILKSLFTATFEHWQVSLRHSGKRSGLQYRRKQVQRPVALFTFGQISFEKVWISLPHSS